MQIRIRTADASAPDAQREIGGRSTSWPPTRPSVRLWAHGAGSGKDPLHPSKVRHAPLLRGAAGRSDLTKTVTTLHATEESVMALDGAGSRWVSLEHWHVHSGVNIQVQSSFQLGATADLGNGNTT